MSRRNPIHVTEEGQQSREGLLAFPYDRSHEAVKQALAHDCCVCKAVRGEDCSMFGRPLVTGIVHMARVPKASLALIQAQPHDSMVVSRPQLEHTMRCVEATTALLSAALAGGEPFVPRDVVAAAHALLERTNECHVSER